MDLKIFSPKTTYLFLLIPKIILIYLLLDCKNQSSFTNEVVLSHFSTPESTIIYYWSQLNKRDYKNALSCFVNYKPSDYDEKKLLPLPDVDSLRIDTILFLKIKNKTAEIHYRVSFFSKRDSCTKSFVTGDRLKMVKEGWKIEEVIFPQKM